MCKGGGEKKNVLFRETEPLSPTPERCRIYLECVCIHNVFYLSLSLIQCTFQHIIYNIHLLCTYIYYILVHSTNGIPRYGTRNWLSRRGWATFFQSFFCLVYYIVYCFQKSIIIYNLYIIYYYYYLFCLTANGSRV